MHGAYEQAKANVRWRERMAESRPEEADGGQAAWATPDDHAGIERTDGDTFDKGGADDRAESLPGSPESGITIDSKTPDPLSEQAVAERELPDIFDERRTAL